MTNAVGIRTKGGRFGGRLVYATEADVLHVALFGRTARQWREANPESEGSIRDEATLHQLVALASLESMNAELVKSGLSRPERAACLSRMAASQLKALGDNATIRGIEGGEDGADGGLAAPQLP